MSTDARTRPRRLAAVTVVAGIMISSIAVAARAQSPSTGDAPRLRVGTTINP